jgi:uncharacterized protein YggE
MMQVTNYQEVKSFSLKFHLYQNYPNPFKRNTIISYSVPYKTKVRIIVTDSSGNIVDKLVSEEHVTGIYDVNFNCKNLSEGIYFYQLIAGNNFETKSMVLIK